MNWQLSNLLRAIAITVVIWIHASNRWWFGIDGNVSIGAIDGVVFFDTFVNQVGRLAVPLFVILSGFGLAKSELSRPFELIVFIQRRCLRILPPYIFFTILNLAFRPQFQVANGVEKLGQLLQALGDGSGDYHLYFLVIIVQCYCSYPLLRLFPFSGKNLAVLLFCHFSLLLLRWSISLFGWFDSMASYVPDSNHWIYWLPYFLLGIWLGRDPDWWTKLVQYLSTRQWTLLWGIAAILELGEFYFAVLRIGSASAVGHYGRPTVLLLTLVFLLWAMSWRNWERWIPNCLVDPPGKASFTTYLIHTQVLRLLFPLEVLGGIAYPLIAAIASWGVGIWLWKTCRKVNGLNLLVGA